MFCGFLCKKYIKIYSDVMTINPPTRILRILWKSPGPETRLSIGVAYSSQSRAIQTITAATLPIAKCTQITCMLYTVYIAICLIILCCHVITLITYSNSTVFYKQNNYNEIRKIALMYQCSIILSSKELIDEVTL